MKNLEKLNLPISLLIAMINNIAYKIQILVLFVSSICVRAQDCGNRFRTTCGVTLSNELDESVLEILVLVSV